MQGNTVTRAGDMSPEFPRSTVRRDAVRALLAMDNAAVRPIRPAKLPNLLLRGPLANWFPVFSIVLGQGSSVRRNNIAITNEQVHEFGMNEELFFSDLRLSQHADRHQLF